MNFRSPLRKAMNQVFGDGTFDKRRPGEPFQRVHEVAAALQARSRRTAADEALRDVPPPATPTPSPSPSMRRSRSAVLPPAPVNGASWDSLSPDIRLLIYDRFHPEDRQVFRLVSRRVAAEVMTRPFIEAREHMRAARRGLAEALLEITHPVSTAPFRAAGLHLGPTTLAQTADTLFEMSIPAPTAGTAVGAIAAGLGDRAGPFLAHVTELVRTKAIARERIDAWPFRDRLVRTATICRIAVECGALPDDLMDPLVELAGDPLAVEAVELIDGIDAAANAPVNAMRMACKAVIAQLKVMPGLGLNIRRDAESLLSVVAPSVGVVDGNEDPLQATIRVGLKEMLQEATPDARAHFFRDCRGAMREARLRLTLTERTRWDTTFDPLRTGPGSAAT